MAGCVAYCWGGAREAGRFVCECGAVGAFVVTQLVAQIARCLLGERFCRNFHLAAAWGYACIADMRRRFAVWRMGNVQAERDRLAKENRALRNEVERLKGASENLATAAGQNELLKELLQTDGQEKCSMAAQLALSTEFMRRLEKTVQDLGTQLEDASASIKQLKRERDEGLVKIKELECSVVMLSQEGTETPFKAACLKTFEAIAKVLPKLADARPDERVKPLLEAQRILETQNSESLRFLEENVLKLTDTRESRAAISDIRWFLQSTQRLYAVSQFVIGGSENERS